MLPCWRPHRTLPTLKVAQASSLHCSIGFQPVFGGRPRTLDSTRVSGSAGSSSEKNYA